MRGHFRYLRFKTFPMTPRTPQCKVFCPLLSSSEHSGVPEDSNSRLFQVLGFTPTLGQSRGATTHATKVGRHLAVKLAQSYLKRYASTWWKIVRQEEGKNHGYTWEFFKEHIELQFIPKNSDYISRCKLHDLVNVTNDNLC
jgi:hypothetical protein